MTDEEKKSVVQDVLNEIQTNSHSVDELDTATSLDGINSLPAQQGDKLVRVPVSLLGQSAADAAVAASAAAEKARKASAEADTATGNANAATESANAAAEKAAKAAEDASAAASSIDSYDSRIKLAENGASARFSQFVEGKTIRGTTKETDGVVVFDTSAKKFAYKCSTVEPLSTFSTDTVVDPTPIDMFFYYAEWPTVNMYMNADRTAVLKDKAYLMGGAVYVWSEEENTLVELSGSGGGNTYNVTEEVPLDDGFYTLETAVKAVETKYRAKGRCVTYETAQGKWETKQFIGTSLDSWEQAASWEDFGGAGTVKSVTVNGQKQAPDSTGNVSITINETEVDESLNETSTNPVQNAAVTARLKEVEASLSLIHI